MENRKKQWREKWRESTGIRKGTGREMEGEKLVNGIKESASCRIRKIIGKCKGQAIFSIASAWHENYSLTDIKYEL